MTPGSATVPSAEFINSLASWAWLEETAAGPVAFLLLAHPEADTVAGELAGLAEALGLAAPQSRLPDTGERVLVVGTTRAVVAVDGCRHVVLVEVGPHWSEFVRTGGRIALLVGLIPLARNSPRDAVEEYLGRSALNGRLRLGTASVRSASSQQR